jgi:hypothetical protein
VPNQEKTLSQFTSVTYRDKPYDMQRILLPNWEIKQAVFCILLSNSFGLQAKQERESQEFQNCTNSDHCRWYDLVSAISELNFLIKRTHRKYLVRAGPLGFVQTLGGRGGKNDTGNFGGSDGRKKIVRKAAARTAPRPARVRR